MALPGLREGTLWLAKESAFANLSPSLLVEDDRSRRFNQAYFPLGELIKFSSRSRLLLPESLIKYAAIGPEVVLRGFHDYIEIADSNSCLFHDNALWDSLSSALDHRMRSINEFAYATLVPSQSGLLVPSVLIDLRSCFDEITRAIQAGRQQLTSLSPRAFEEFVAELLSRNGFVNVVLTQRTRDGGRDIVASFPNAFTKPLITIVECKRYAAHRPIRVSTVRELLGVIHSSDLKADRGIIATTSSLTRDALRIVEKQYSLSKLDHDDLMQHLGMTQNDNGLWIPAR